MVLLLWFLGHRAFIFALTPATGWLGWEWLALCTWGQGGTHLAASRLEVSLHHFASLVHNTMAKLGVRIYLSFQQWDLDWDLELVSCATLIDGRRFRLFVSRVV